MSRVKKEPELMKSDLMELYSRSLLALTDLMAIANDKGFDISIFINDNGTIDFKTWEMTSEKMYSKNYSVSGDSITYAESEYNRE